MNRLLHFGISAVMIALLAFVSIYLTIWVQVRWFSLHNASLYPAVISVSHADSDGLLGWWPLESDDADRSGNHNGGNGAQYAAFFRTKKAYGLTSAMTLSASIYQTQPVASAPEAILAETDFATGFGLYSLPGGSVRFALYGKSAHLLDTARGLVAPGKWYRIVATYDGQTQHLFIDGSEAAESSFHDTLSTGDCGFAIGMEACGNSLDVFNGDIRDVRIYDRALQPRQIPDSQ